MNFTHLQVRSGYSLMKSTNKIEKVVQRAKDLGFDKIALTDESVMFGAISFYQTCIRMGVKPILGMIIEITLNDCNERCVLLARNNNGYKNLIKISTSIQRDKQIFDPSSLKKYIDGLILVLPYSASFLSKRDSYNEEEMREYLNTWKNIVPDQYFYLGIDTGKRDILIKLKEICLSYQLKATAIGDVRYLLERDYIAYDCLQAMRNSAKWSYKNAVDLGAEKYHLLSQEEVNAIFADVWPEIIKESSEIAKKCNVSLSLNETLLPSFPLDSGQEATSYLRKLCFQALNRIYPSNQSAIDRLNYELQIIDSMNFNDYFLIVWDFVQYAKKKGIMVGPGRGSAAGSLVSFLLGITNVDPIKYNLLFERFLNPERISMPDIDIDFSDHRRDEVINYVKNKYGSEHVAQIITFGTFGTRSLLRELIKVMGIDSQDEVYLLKQFPTNSDKSIAEGIKSSAELTNYVKQSPKLQVLFKIATRLEGIPRHISTHAAGVVISEQQLVEHVPLISSNGDISLTQFAMKQLEAIGLLKMDFLGLRNLTLIERIRSSIEQKENKKLDLSNISLDDEKTFALLQKGMTNGVFQLESLGMQRVLKELIPTNFEDVVAVNALFRPGPMDYIPVYIRRKHGLEETTYPHHDLKPILQNTYGVLVYQEQIMQIANKMAGFSLGQADILRRAVSKKQREEIEQLRASFITGCKQNGYKQSVAEEIFTWIVRFSNYGFNRSHAVAYSIVSYQLAYLKAHYPSHFFAELLSSVTGNHDKIRLYIKEAREFNIDTLPPSINKSFGRYTVEGHHIRMGLSSIKGVGHQVVKEIIKARKDHAFRHLFDFCLRVPLNIVNRPVIESLVLVGAFDETLNNRASLLATIDQAIEQGELFREFEDQPSFFQNELEASYLETEPFTQMKQLAMEKDLIGLYLSSHPIASYRKKLRSNGYLELSELNKLLGKNNVMSCSVIQAIKTIRTKRGESMAFLTLADEGSEMEAVVFPDLFRKISRWLKEEMIVFISGKPEERKGNVQLLISDINPFDEALLDESSTNRVFVKITDQNEKHTLLSIKKIADEFPGAVPVIVYHEKTRATYQLASEYFVQLNKSCLQSFYNIFGKERVAVQSK